MSSINAKSKREQRLIRKRWRENSNRYKDKQAAVAKGSNFIEENTPNSPASPAIINLRKAS